MVKVAVSVVLCLVLALTGVACTSERYVVRPDATTTVDKLRIGEYVNITARNGKTYFIEVGEIGADYVRGRNPETGKVYRIPYAQIEMLQYASVDPVKTAAGVGGTLIVAMTVVFVIAIAAIGDAFGDSMDDLFGGGGC